MTKARQRERARRRKAAMHNGASHWPPPDGERKFYHGGPAGIAIGGYLVPGRPQRTMIGSVASGWKHFMRGGWERRR